MDTASPIAGRANTGHAIILAAVLALGSGCSGSWTHAVNDGHAAGGTVRHGSTRTNTTLSLNDYVSACRAGLQQEPAIVHLSTGETVASCGSDSYVVFDIDGLRRYTFPRWELLQSVDRYHCMNLAVTPGSGDCDALEELLTRPE